MQHVDAPPLGETRHVGQLVDDAASDEHPPPAHPPAPGGSDEEVVDLSGQPDDAVGQHLDAVRRHLGAADLEQLQRVDPLTAQVVVGVVGGRVAGLARVDDQHRPLRATERHRAAQPGRAATDHHHVVLLVDLRHGTSMRRPSRD